ncbi:MAG: hypothetical protein M1812_000879 [Candelaria pacifica]|nr:MAG: hypothetical protein M1812_000879 [Candelaria pacifica]
MHHKLGWVLTWAVSAQALMGFLDGYTGSRDPSDIPEEKGSFVPISVSAMAQHRRDNVGTDTLEYRYSKDSGQGTERRSSSLRSHSSESSDNSERQGLVEPYPLSQFNECDAGNIESTLQLRPLSGFVIPKGGIFFWYGLLTLGRWMGCFADLGWAWNIKPSKRIVSSRKASAPSAEFVESLVIFIYGSSNVFLEHLAGWGGAWTAQDLEHVSISVMFLGGGLCGMLIESIKVRHLLNRPIHLEPDPRDASESHEEWQEPKTYEFSMNPLPGLIIFLLGLMMSSHHQSSMVSTMVHKQWGTLLVGYSLARAVTYIIFYLSPPTSLLPSRPPSELISSFCLISGGLVFMASNKDTVAAMDDNGLDAMFIFTLTMGLTAFLMAWAMLVVAVKGWALRRTSRRATKMLAM